MSLTPKILSLRIFHWQLPDLPQESHARQHNSHTEKKLLQSSERSRLNVFPRNPLAATHNPAVAATAATAATITATVTSTPATLLPQPLHLERL